MKKEHILIIEDEEPIQDLLSFHLECEGYSLSQARTGEAGLLFAQQEKTDLILLDLMLPQIDGLEVCRQLKKNPETKDIPIILLTAKGDDGDVITGLELGAEDYIVKPFSHKVLLARTRTALRRKRKFLEEQKVASEMEVGPIKLNFETRLIEVGEKKIELRKSEFELLALLMQQPGRVFTRHQILEFTKGDDLVVTERAVDVQVVGLRKSLGDTGSLIKTVRGVGYKFEVN